jgi:hypothetical protein
MVRGGGGRKWIRMSRISDGVLMVLSQIVRPCLNFLGPKRTHSRVSGLNGEALFSELSKKLGVSVPYGTTLFLSF